MHVHEPQLGGVAGRSLRSHRILLPAPALPMLLSDFCLAWDYGACTPVMLPLLRYLGKCAHCTAQVNQVNVCRNAVRAGAAVNDFTASAAGGIIAASVRDGLTANCNAQLAGGASKLCYCPLSSPTHPDHGLIYS